MSGTQLRVLDLTDPLGWYGARLLVGLGAEVVRLEPEPVEESDAIRRHWHAGKRRHLTDDLNAEIERLIADADVVLESGPLRALVTPGLRAAAPERWAHLVHVVTTPFGLTGPRRDWLADDLVLNAAGGMAWLGGDPGAPPEPPPREQALHLAGAHTAVGALLGVLARQRTGHGELVDVSAQEAVAATLETGAVAWIHAGTIPARTSGVYGHVAHRVFATADGYVAGGYSGSNRMWDDLLAWMVDTGTAEDLAEEKWADPITRWNGRPHVDSVVTRFAAGWSGGPLADEARRRALPWAEVVPPSRLPENPQLLARDFFVDLDEPDGTIRDLGFPFAAAGQPRPVRLAARVPSSTPASWSGTPSSRSGLTAPEPLSSPGRALSGVRVLDLTWVLAGPYVTKTLGDHGADVLKVESKHRQDPTRFSPGMRLRPGATADESGYFLNFNRNKRSIALNLRTPDGARLLRDLVPHVDVVVENFSPGVLARWGMSYDELRAMNPGIVLVSMAGVGQDGPWRDAVTFADTLAAMSGITYETGRDDRAPQGLTFGLGDMVAANAAVLGTLDLLRQGNGGHLDLSQLEAMSAQLGLAVLDPGSGAASAPRVFRTAGDDRWLAVAPVETDRLRAALDALSAGLPSPGFTLEEILLYLDADHVAAELQRHGIGAYAVRDGRDLVTRDDQLAARQFYLDREHPLVGPVLHEGIVARLSHSPGDIDRPAPLLGEHTDALLGEILGLTPDELARLHTEGVLE